MSTETYPNYNSILSEKFLSKYRDKNPNWGFNGLGYLIYKRTYSRPILDESGKISRYEEWWETVKRCIEGAQKIGSKYTQEEAERLYDYVFNLKGFFSGRAFWALGTPASEQYADALLNCWGTKTSEISDFGFIFMESMFGGGVGCNISREYTQELPRVKRGVRCTFKNTNDAEYIIPDSKEGWNNLFQNILKSYLVTGQSFTYSTVCIRPQGQPIKTHGGIAPGPAPLIKGAELLCKILESREGKKLRTSDVADIICIGGETVKSGGVRRTALILGGDPDDAGYIELKRWDLGTIPYYRSNSNNSILAPYFRYISPQFWEGYNGNGEAYGLLNLRNARRFGRIGESDWKGFDLKEPNIIIFNPCSEACLEDKEPCNLVDIPINNINSYDEFIDIVKLLYKYQKSVCSLNYYHEESNKIVHKNFKLGMGITGIAQKLDVYQKWCDKAYRELRAFDESWSKKNGWPQSIRLTVIKPSGTLSLLSGSTPGGHPGYSKHFIRRVRLGSTDPLIEVLKSINVPMEYEKKMDGGLRHDVLVASFPCSFDDNTLLSKDCSAIKQLEIVKSLQTVWADQAVSVTIYYKKEELSDIKKWLSENYDDCIKSVSFLLHSDHNFEQAPYEEINEEKYNELCKSIKPISSIISKNINSEELLDGLECQNGVCPIR